MSADDKERLKRWSPYGVGAVAGLVIPSAYFANTLAISIALAGLVGIATSSVRGSKWPSNRKTGALLTCDELARMGRSSAGLCVVFLCILAYAVSFGWYILASIVLFLGLMFGQQAVTSYWKARQVSDEVAAVTAAERIRDAAIRYLTGEIDTRRLSRTFDAHLQELRSVRPVDRRFADLYIAIQSWARPSKDPWKDEAQVRDAADAVRTWPMSNNFETPSSG
jgi:hypothetical protein